MALADLPRVLRIPRTDDAEENFILLHVSSTGRHLLDLKLIGTDNEAAFSAKVKHARASDLKTKNFPGTQSQWEEALSAVLLANAGTEFSEGVEAVAKVLADTSITITIQKSIEGIKQRYGTITLAYTEDETIDLFSWCAQTIQSKEASSGGLEAMQAELKAKNEEVKKLDEKLEELVRSKAAYEDELVEKFSILLNEKKLKIRDQQRLLAGANVDPARLARVEQGRIPQRDSRPGPSRRGKRKAGQAVKDESDDDTDDGFEKMDVDAEAKAAGLEPDPNSADEDERQTDDEASTADEDSGEEPPSKQLPTRNSNNASASSSGTAAGKEAVVPPKRDLPFSKKPTIPAKPAVPAVEGSETESDDEL
ncbi:hypothetical protein D0Z07_6049 [Hyphodiscus hymeniophilus]|uniref:XRCC4 coiled-coil domain-containing protein n=1 Tax=Hyphodiscus hymeniophilus TaxID=353542 RepID=A0A9P6VHL5_9HELO|nr:hypothetical protein D0Z07_6049 [Hyphodiscus hymeniophilus]